MFLYVKHALRRHLIFAHVRSLRRTIGVIDMRYRLNFA